MIVRIERLAQGGPGLGHLDDGKAVFVQGGLPGETVQAAPIRQTASYVIARLETVVSGRSPDRVDPVCPLRDRCGGCDLMHLARPAQLKAKEALFLEALARQRAPLDGFEFEGTASGEPLGYRTRVRFQTDGKQVGFFQKGARTLVPIPSCPVLHPRLDALLGDPSLLLRHRAGAEIPVCLAEEPVLGAEVGWVPILGRRIPVSNSVFFQSNLGLLPEMAAYVVSKVSGRRVADLYSGVGLFSAFLEDGHEVVAVERNPACLALARRHLRRASFFTSAVEDFPFKNGADTIVVDPPRTGLGRKVLDLLRGSGAARVVYVSCDCATFARDAGRLGEGGLVLRSSKLFDFYPQTSHMESVSVFERRPR